MSLHPSPIGAVPAETARVAALAFPRGTVATRLRDEFAAPLRGRGLPRPLPAPRPARAAALAPGALVTVLQFQEHLSDSGDVDAELIAKSERRYGVALHGPVCGLSTWASRAGHGYDLPHFHIDWARREVTCPEGRRSVTWTEGHDGAGSARIHARFSRTDCGACPARTRCTPVKATRRAIYFPSPRALRGVGRGALADARSGLAQGLCHAGRRQETPPVAPPCSVDDLGA